MYPEGRGTHRRGSHLGMRWSPVRVCVCVCVCMYIYIYMCMCVYVFVLVSYAGKKSGISSTRAGHRDIHTRTPKRTHTRTHTHTQRSTQKRDLTPLPNHAYTQAHTHSKTHTQTHTPEYTERRSPTPSPSTSPIIAGENQFISRTWGGDSSTMYPKPSLWLSTDLGASPIAHTRPNCSPACGEELGRSRMRFSSHVHRISPVCASTEWRCPPLPPNTREPTVRVRVCACE